MTGMVAPDLQPLVRIQLSHDNRQAAFDAIVDTGFNSYLTVSPAIVNELSLTTVGSNEVTLADGSRIIVEVYEAVLEWDDQKLLVEAYQSFGTPLLGTALLQNHKIQIEVRDGGGVLIEPLL